MNNMMYPYMQNNMMSLEYQFNKLNDLEHRVNRLEREIHRLSKKISNSDIKNPMPLTSTPNVDIKDSTNVYMV